jgi:hypothetical protein
MKVSKLPVPDGLTPFSPLVRLGLETVLALLSDNKSPKW